MEKIWLYSLPLMATNVLQVLFNLADLAVVGQFGGPGALGSVGSTTQLVTLFTGFIISMSGESMYWWHWPEGKRTQRKRLILYIQLQ